MRIHRFAIAVAVIAAAASVAVPALASTSETRRLAWHEDLAGATATNITGTAGAVRIADPTMRLGTQPGPAGFLVTRERPVAAPVNRVRVAVAATVPTGAAVGVEVRGRSAAGRWSEW